MGAEQPFEVYTHHRNLKWGIYILLHVYTYYITYTMPRIQANEIKKPMPFHLTSAKQETRECYYITTP